MKTGGFGLALAGVVAHRASLAVAGMVVGALTGATVCHLWLGIPLLRRSSGHGAKEAAGVPGPEAT